MIFYALGVCEAIYRKHGCNMVVTSLNDSHDHRPNSLHSRDGLGRAFDLRTNNIPIMTSSTIFKEITEALDPLGFDIIFHQDEWDGTGKQIMFQHIHGEFDPKGAETWVTRT